MYPRVKKLYSFSPEELEIELREVIDFALYTEEKLIVTVVKDDTDDNKYLSCALEGRADYIISGDKHLKNLKEFQGIKIVTPDTFLSIFNNQS